MVTLMSNMLLWQHDVNEQLFYISTLVLKMEKKAKVTVLMDRSRNPITYNIIYV